MNIFSQIPWQGDPTVASAPVEGDVVVIAMGPWSVLAASWLPSPTVFGLKGAASRSTPARRCRARRCFSKTRNASI